MDASRRRSSPSIGDLIRQTPGTISLGQGVVHYGPPRGGDRGGGAAAVGRASSHEYQDGHGQPALVERSDAQAAARERHRRRARQPRHGHRRRNMAFMHAAARDHRARRRSHPAGAVLLQPRDGDSDGRLPRRARPHRRAVSAATSTPFAPRSPLARAPSSPSRRTIRAAPCSPSASLRELNALCRDRGIYHISDEAYEYFTYGEARHVSPGLVRRRGGPHDLAVFAVEGLRVGGLAHRLHGVSRAPRQSAMAKVQDTILICPPVISQVAARGGDGRRAGVLRAASCATLADVREVVLAQLRALEPLARCRRPTARSTAVCG